MNTSNYYDISKYKFDLSGKQFGNGPNLSFQGKKDRLPYFYLFSGSYLSHHADQEDQKN